MNLPAWTGLAGIGAVAAIVAGAWGYLKTFFGWLQDLVICRAAVTGETANALMSYCWSRGKRSPFGLRAFGGTSLWVQPVKRMQVVAFETMSSDPILFWFGNRPLILRRKSSHDETNTGNEEGNYNRNLFIYFMRGTLDLDTLINEAVRSFNHKRQGINGESLRKRFHVCRIAGNLRDENGMARLSDKSAAPEGISSGSMDQINELLVQKTMRLLEWKPEDLIQATPNRPAFHGYAFPPVIIDAMSEMDLWLKNEEWFRSKSVPWRRGWLLSGPPGTGKSTLVRAMAMHFDLPVFSIDLSTHDNNSFAEGWTKISANAPCIALIEDIDTVFNGRENVSVHNKQRDHLTFDCLLNSISGIQNSEGIFLIITTNHPETLDAALGIMKEGKSSRPGRLDRIIELGFMAETERHLLANHILSDFPEAINPAIVAGDSMTPAQFQDHCAQKALQLFWKKSHNNKQ